MFGGLLDSFGMIPDILRGKKPGEALRDNVLSVATAVAAPNLMASAPGAAAPAAQAPQGLLSEVGGYVKPAMQGLQAASQAQGLLGGQEQPFQVQPMQLRPGPDMSGILSAQQQSEALRAQEDEQRRRAHQMAVQGLLGGGYGRTA